MFPGSLLFLCATLENQEEPGDHTTLVVSHFNGQLLLVIVIDTVEPLCSGHLWGMKIWPLYRGGPNLRGFYITVSLVPRPLPVFQCCTLKNERATLKN